MFEYISAPKAAVKWGISESAQSPAKEIRRQGIAEDISAKSVSRFLKGSQFKTP